MPGRNYLCYMDESLGIGRRAFMAIGARPGMEEEFSAGDIKSLFSGRVSDAGSRILREEHRILDGIPVLLEHWDWEGAGGSSLVFRTEDVGGWSDEQLRDFAATNIDGWPQAAPVAIRRGERFILLKGA